MPSLAHLCILLSGFFCEVGVGGRGVMGGDHLNFQMGTRPEKTLGRSLYNVGPLSKKWRLSNDFKISRCQILAGQSITVKSSIRISQFIIQSVGVV